MANNNRRCDIHAVTDRFMNQFFHEWGPEQTDAVRFNGRTLREWVQAHLRARSSDTARPTHRFVEEMSRAFAPDADPHRHLIMEDPELDIDEDLQNLAPSSYFGPTSWSLLQSYLESEKGPPNQSEVVVVVRLALRSFPRPSSRLSPMEAPRIMAVARWAVKWDLESRFPREIEALKKPLDMALKGTWQEQSHRGVDARSFFATHQDLLGMITADWLIESYFR